MSLSSRSEKSVWQAQTCSRRTKPWLVNSRVAFCLTDLLLRLGAQPVLDEFHNGDVTCKQVTVDLSASHAGRTPRP